MVKIKPLPEVWDKALELAGGDVRRLQVEAPDVVLVRNGWVPIAPPMQRRRASGSR